jgi:4-amino-4-deoxy-L-arabinose transferase-like glycosyltransferase
LLALMLVQLAVQPPPTLIVGLDQDRRALVRFHAVEFQDETAYRWSEPRAAIFLYGFEGRRAIVTLRMAAARPPELSPVIVAMQAAGRPIGQVAVGIDWRRYHVLTPTEANGETPLQLDTAEFSAGGADTRLLGVALSAVGSRSTTEMALLPPFSRSVFLVSLPLLAALAAWRWRRALDTAALVAAPLLLLISWAAAYPAAGGYWLPTLMWPWWPLLPLLLLIGWPWFVAVWRTLVISMQGRRWPAVFGLALALLALYGVRLGLPHWFATFTILGGVLLALVALNFGQQLDAIWLNASRSTRIGVAEWLLIAAITALALALRFFNLDAQPLGLWRDEARHGLLALQIWQDAGFRPVYVVEGADLPALLFYLMAPIVGFFGPELWSARFVAAFIGAFTPLALWWAVRPLLGPRATLLAALMLAGASWSLSMSRWAFPATLDSFFVLCAIGAVLRALELAEPGRETAVRSAIPVAAVLLMAAGAFSAGLAAYTYHTGRVAPLILAAVVAAYLGRSWRSWQRALPLLTVAVLVGVLTMTPLLSFFAENAAGFNRRVGRVTVFDSIELDRHAPAALLLRNVERYAAMWHLRGELNGRHHAPGAPMLDPIAGLLFLLGLGLALSSAAARQGADRRAVLLLAWLSVALIPGLFSSEAPHAMRSLPALAPACALIGLAASFLGASNKRQETGEIRIGALHFYSTLVRNQVVIALLLSASLAFNSWLYFKQMAHDPRVYSEFDTIETAMGHLVRKAATAPETVAVLLPERVRERESLRFLAHDLPVDFYDEKGVRIDNDAAALFVLTGDASPEELVAAQAALGGDARVLRGGPQYPDGTPILRGVGRGVAAQLLWETMD